ncbi:deoxyribodipyrimidine photolyase [Nitzschia inconspicua]|uniref:Deoxyribodipyrimidine photo-lyase n=1 Tax=Nitzschia inconspicua TaxID=303405 RepID=A0A9K3M4F8_9STRA|nr:deoxyribodipyrimidine photolyase [Nitzschia inconspicua]
MSSSSYQTIDHDFEYNFSFYKVNGDLLPDWFLQERVRKLTTPHNGSDDTLLPDGNCVVYWMQRDMRTKDNHALLLAQAMAQRQQVPLYVCHVLIPGGTPESGGSVPVPMQELPITERYGSFYLGGLQCVFDELKAQKVPLYIVHSQPYGEVYAPCHHKAVTHAIQEQVVLQSHIRPQLIILDTSPIRQFRQWHEGFAANFQSNIPIWQVDAHNVVPIWYASPKREYGARTIRSKLNKLVDDCLQADQYKKGQIPEFQGNQHMKSLPVEIPKTFDRQSHEAYLNWDTSVPAVQYWKPGTQAALHRFDEFIRSGLPKFDQLRNDPNYNRQICSQLSPYFNLGQLAFATCMLRLKTHNRDATGKASFIEEGFVRKELSDNFCWYSPHDYDALSTTADWAKETLEIHASDPREYVYTLQQLEQGQTHDDLWNASQLQLVQEGKLHGFLRMYWAKKILEWTPDPTTALEYAQYFNDHYALDGRCPNGFVGVGWSIMGIHDQGWKERDVFGKIRFMNYNGCKRKFKVPEFVQKYPPAAENAAKAQNKPEGTGEKRPANDTNGGNNSNKKKTKQVNS